METIDIKTFEKLATDVDRIILFAKSIAISINEFESYIGVSQNYFKNCQNNSVCISSKVLLRIAKNYPQLNILWVITGKHKMILEDSGNLLSLAS